MSIYRSAVPKMVESDLFAGNGTGTTLDWDFCSSNNPCAEREGDCDNDAQCAQGFVCGGDNCRDFWNQAEPNADCCIPGNIIVNQTKQFCETGCFKQY